MSVRDNVPIGIWLPVTDSLISVTGYQFLKGRLYNIKHDFVFDKSLDFRFVSLEDNFELL